MEETFLPFLDKWEASVNARSEYSKAQKKRMLLSNGILIGIRRTGTVLSELSSSTCLFISNYFSAVKSFVELVRFLFTLPEVQEYNLKSLSNQLCQDPLEGFFGFQRQRGGTSDNPSAVEFYNNTQALRVIDSFCRPSVRGNCRMTQKQDRMNHAADGTPLPKRKRLSQKKLL